MSRLHPLNVILLLLLAFSYSSFSSLLDTVSPILTGDTCNICRDIVKNFKMGLSKTAKSNFGGGNTHWEEKSLGRFAYSETRLLEITEHLCPDSGKEEKVCHGMVEANEEAIEAWWFEHYAKQKNTDLNQYLCVDRIGACCPNGTYGMSCTDCLGGREKPCGGRGKCLGDGTRDGSGECICHGGYNGDLCTQCDKGYYKEDGADANDVKCKQCHTSCKGECSGPGPKGCSECADGWSMTSSEGCADDNECDDNEMCEENEFCTNTIGSFRCTRCNAVCSTCTGSLHTDCMECASKHFNAAAPTSVAKQCEPCHRSCLSSCRDATARSCDACAAGWAMHGNGDECEDVNECKLNDGSAKCASDEYCVNSIGSYTCSTCHSSCRGCDAPGNEGCLECKDGYARVERKCVDIDECSVSSGSTDGKEVVPPKCGGLHTVCVNIPGSYRCDCETGFVRVDGECVTKPKNYKEDTKKPATESKTSTTKKSKTKNSKQSKSAFWARWRDPLSYFGSMVAFVLFATVLQRYLYAQCVLTIIFTWYLHWLGLKLEKSMLKH